MERYYSCPEVAERFGVELCTVWGWIRRKKLSAIKTGKNYSIRPEDLKKFEDERKTV